MLDNIYFEDQNTKEEDIQGFNSKEQDTNLGSTFWRCSHCGLINYHYHDMCLCEFQSIR